MLDKMDKEVVDREWLSHVEELAQEINKVIRNGYPSGSDYKMSLSKDEFTKLKQAIKNVMLP